MCFLCGTYLARTVDGSPTDHRDRNGDVPPDDDFYDLKIIGV